MPRVLFLTNEDDPLKDKVLGAAEGRLEVEISSDAAALREVSGFNALLIGDLRLGEQLTALEGPRLVQLTRGDHADLDVLALTSSAVTVAGASPALAPFVAEHALGLAAGAIASDGPRGLVDRERIADAFPGLRDHLAGLKLGIVGFGRVGQEMARQAKGVFKSVIYADVRTASHDAANRYGLRRSTLDLLLSTCDVVSLHAHWGPTADPLIGERELRLMGDGAALVNVADGRLIDENALLAALGSGAIKAAGLDVVSGGAPDESHPMARLSNVALTPYVAARTDEADDAVARFVVENIERAALGEAPGGVIEMIDYPRSGDPAFWSSRMAPRI